MVNVWFLHYMFYSREKELKLTEFIMHVKEMTKYRELPSDLSSIRSEVLECLVDGLQFLKSDAEIPAQKLANRILANIIIEHLDISGYGIHRKNSCSELVSGAERNFSIVTI